MVVVVGGGGRIIGWIFRMVVGIFVLVVVVGGVRRIAGAVYSCVVIVGIKFYI